jgi:hypothetical protein
LIRRSCPNLEIVTAENGKLDKVPTRRFLKLPIPAEPMNSVLAVLVTLVAKSDHEHFVLRNSLSVEMNNVVVMFSRSAANAVRIIERDPITITALRCCHLKRNVVV